MSTQLADGPAAPLPTRSPYAASPASTTAATTAIVLVLLVGVGFALRLVVARQSLFADELSTYWISATHSLGGVLSLMYGTGRIKHAEITPPVLFLLSWLTSHIGHAAIWLRLPSLIAGTVSIVLVFLLGRRTVGRSAALLAAAVTALAPFMIYYSGEARAYAVMMALTLGSTLSMLCAIDTRRNRWWVAYALCSWGAFLTHYTCAFVLAVQFLWLLWAHPEARRPAFIANVGAAAAVLPWLPGLIQDFTSPTLKILSALSPFTLHEIRLDVEHWLVGYPYVEAGGLKALPGAPTLILLGAAALLSAGGLLLAATRARPARAAVDRRILLIVLLALAVPVGEALASLTGNHIFGVRNLAASWPFVALACAGGVVRAGRRIAPVAAALALVAFALAAVKMMSERFDRPRYQAAADYVAQHARPGDVVLDTTGSLSPGPLTGYDVASLGENRLTVVRGQSPAERDHPYGFADPIVALPEAVRLAVAAAHGKRVFLVETKFTTTITPLQRRLSDTAVRFPAPYRLVAQQDYPSIGLTRVRVFAPAGLSGP